MSGFMGENIPGPYVEVVVYIVLCHGETVTAVFAATKCVLNLCAYIL